jgi:hypothetical protein
MNITRIYLVTNCFGDPNKVYIGKTKNSRKNEHIKTFGNQIEYSYIDEINSIKSKDWKPLECFWIIYFKFLGFDVQNKNEGGSGADEYSEEIKLKMRKPKPKGYGKHLKDKDRIEKIRLSNKGKKHKGGENISKGKSHPIEQYDVNGKFIKLWDSRREIIEILKITNNAIGNHLSGRSNTTGGFVFKYKVKPSRKVGKKPKGFGDKITKKIIQLNKQGEFIKEWSSQKIAGKKLNIIPSDISACCRGKQKTAGGYIWKFKEN